MNSREWLVRENDEALSSRVARECSLLPLTAKILVNRGLTEKDEINSFLDKDTMPIHDPFLLADMDKAVARIEKAIAEKQRVCIAAYCHDSDETTYYRPYVTAERNCNE